MDDFLVVESASALKLVVFPVSVIGDLIIRVVEHSLSAHFVLSPLTDVLSSFVVVEYSLAVAHVVEFSALVSTSQVSLSHVL